MIGIRRFLHDSEAATAVEYAVMLAMIIAAIITSIGAVGVETGGLWGNIRSGLSAAGFGS